MRTITLLAPNFRMIVRGLLYTKGFRDLDGLSTKVLKTLDTFQTVRSGYQPQKFGTASYLR